MADYCMDDSLYFSDHDDHDQGVPIAYSKLIAETEKSTLYLMDGNKVWIPKSQQISDDGTSVVIPVWLLIRIRDTLGK